MRLRRMTLGHYPTVTLADPVCPSYVQIIVAVPTPTAVTTPDVETMTTDVALEANAHSRDFRCASERDHILIQRQASLLRSERAVGGGVSNRSRSYAASAAAIDVSPASPHQIATLAKVLRRANPATSGRTVPS